MNIWIIVILIGFIAGIFGGLLGIGGAVVIIPALVMLLGFSQQAAQGTTLLMLVMPVGAMAAWQYYRAGMVDVKIAIILGVTFFIGGFVGAKLAIHIPQDILKKSFAILLIILAVKMLFFEK